MPKVPIQNESAEEALIGAALLSGDALEVLAHEVEPEDFWGIRNQIIAVALRRLWNSGIQIESVTVADELERTGDLARVGGLAHLLGLMANCPATSLASNYARIVLDYAVRRRLLQAAEEISEQIRTAGQTGVDELMEKAREAFGSVEMPVLRGEMDPDVNTFLQGPEDYDWLIEGLLERRDRLMITGTEGGGKSEALRQIAVCCSAGLHPFRQTFLPEGAIKVLLVDCENSEVQIRRKLRRVVNLADDVTKGGYDHEMLRIRVKTDGLDLMERTDVRWLFERIEANRPDLLIIGPLYKLHGGDPIDEAPARHVSKTLDSIRHRYGCALMMEAHSPYGTGTGGKRIGRPYGASLWSRWPEFGYSIAANEDDPSEFFFDPWRGPRDEREWPNVLNKGGTWPWMEMGNRSPSTVPTYQQEEQF